MDNVAFPHGDWLSDFSAAVLWSRWQEDSIGDWWWCLSVYGTYFTAKEPEFRSPAALWKLATRGDAGEWGQPNQWALCSARILKYSRERSVETLETNLRPLHTHMHACTPAHTWSSLHTCKYSSIHMRAYAEHKDSRAHGKRLGVVDECSFILFKVLFYFSVCIVLTNEYAREKRQKQTWTVNLEHVKAPWLWSYGYQS